MTANRKFRILAVDDDGDIRTLYETALADDYEIFTAEDGKDALAKIPRLQPDLLISDLMMPEMDGWELLRHFRNESDHNETPVILVSALNSREDVKRGYQFGASVFLTKPFEIPRLKKNVEVSVAARKPRPKKETEEQLRGWLAVSASSTLMGPEAFAAHRFDEERSPSPATYQEPVKPKSSSQTNILKPTIANPSGVHRMPIPITGATGDGTERARVMIVDDDLDAADVLRLIIEQHYDVVVARDGYEALNLIPDVQPDIFVLDAMMPRMSGLQLLDAIRQAPELQECPVILVSAKNLLPQRQQLEKKGVRQIFQKPVRPYEFLSAIQVITNSASFRMRTKADSMVEVQKRVGRKKGDVHGRPAHRPTKETQATMDNFLRENKR